MEEIQIAAVVSAIRDEKARQGKTNQQLSDETGIPIATVSRLLSGAVDNPAFSVVCAVCAALGLSVDSLVGIVPPQPDSQVQQLELEIAHREEVQQKVEQQVALLQERSRLMEAGIAARDDQLHQKDRAIRADRPLIYGLCGLCILLTFSLLFYMVLDFQNPTQGLIRTDSVAPIVWLAVAAILAMFIMLLHITVSRWYRKK